MWAAFMSGQQQHNPRHLWEGQALADTQCAELPKYFVLHAREWTGKYEWLRYAVTPRQTGRPPREHAMAILLQALLGCFLPEGTWRGEATCMESAHLECWTSKGPELKHRHQYRCERCEFIAGNDAGRLEDCSSRMRRSVSVCVFVDYRYTG